MDDLELGDMLFCAKYKIGRRYDEYLTTLVGMFEDENFQRLLKAQIIRPLIESLQRIYLSFSREIRIEIDELSILADNFPGELEANIGFLTRLQAFCRQDVVMQKVKDEERRRSKMTTPINLEMGLIYRKLCDLSVKISMIREEVEDLVSRRKTAMGEIDRLIELIQNIGGDDQQRIRETKNRIERELEKTSREVQRKVHSMCELSFMEERIFKQFAIIEDRQQIENDKLFYLDCLMMVIESFRNRQNAQAEVQHGVADQAPHEEEANAIAGVQAPAHNKRGEIVVANTDAVAQDGIDDFVEPERPRVVMVSDEDIENAKLYYPGRSRAINKERERIAKLEEEQARLQAETRRFRNISNRIDRLIGRFNEKIRKMGETTYGGPFAKRKAQKLREYYDNERMAISEREVIV